MTNKIKISKELTESGNLTEIIGRMKPKCRVTFFLVSGDKISIEIPHSTEEFMDIYTKARCRVVLPAGDDSYSVVYKKSVLAYQIMRL